MTSAPPPPGQGLYGQPSYGQPSYGQPSYGQPAPPPFVPPSVPRSRPVGLIAAVAFVIGAIVAGVVVFFVRSGSDGPQPSSASLSAPSTIGSLKPLKDVQLSGGTNPQQAKNVAAQQKDADANAARLSKLHSGAGTLITQYASNDLQTIVTVTAIRTELDSLYVFTPDPKRLGLAVPMQEVKTFGDVACVVQNPSTTEGNTPDSQQVFATICQRRSPSLTVQLVGLYDSPPQRSATLTDNAFDALS